MIDIHEFQILLTCYFVFMLGHTSDPRTSNTLRLVFKTVNTVLILIIYLTFKQG